MHRDDHPEAHLPGIDQLLGDLAAALSALRPAPVQVPAGVYLPPEPSLGDLAAQASCREATARPAARQRNRAGDVPVEVRAQRSLARRAASTAAPGQQRHSTLPGQRDEAAR